MIVNKEYVKFGSGAVVDEGSIVGYMSSRRVGDLTLMIGANARIRSGSIIYLGSKIGDNFESGHNVIIHEENIIGNNVKIGDNTILEHSSIGNSVTIGSNSVIHQAIIGDEVFIGNSSATGVKPKRVVLTQRKSEKVVSNLKTEIGDGSSILNNCTFYCGSKIGRGCLIADYVHIRENVIIGDNTIIGTVVTINYNSKIGKNVRIMNSTHITGNCIIEDDVFISAGVMTVNDNFFATRNIEFKGPTIKRNAKIGANATILPGITIGENSILGAGAVVTRDIPPNSVAYGIPAKVLERLEDWLKRHKQ